MELRQKDGSVYSRSSILGCRAAVQRHLSQDLKRRDIDVYQDEEFKGANITLDGHLNSKDMKRRGFVKPIEHKDALSLLLDRDFRLLTLVALLVWISMTNHPPFSCSLYLLK